MLLQQPLLLLLLSLLAVPLVAVTPAAGQSAGASGAHLLEDSELLPWEFGRRDGAFRWEGLHNDLPGLLKAQARDNAVALVVFNHGFAPIALNCIVSLVRFGKAHNYVVAAVGDGSIAHCVGLRLPCFNATSVVKHRDFQMPHSTEGDAGRNTQEWFSLVWAKTLVTDAIFQQGYNVLFSDADVVFLKEAFLNYNRLLDEYNADGTFMQEARIANGSDGSITVNKYLNSGNFFIRNNFRTREMMTEWIVGYFQQGSKNGNQLWLNWMKDHPGSPYGLCTTREQCTALKNQGIAAILPHPSQFDGRAQMCLPSGFKDICADRRLYIHAVCLSGGQAKRRALEKLGLWFVHVYAMPDDISVRVPSSSGLPCVTQEAWRSTVDSL